MLLAMFLFQQLTLIPQDTSTMRSVMLVFEQCFNVVKIYEKSVQLYSEVGWDWVEWK